MTPQPSARAPYALLVLFAVLATAIAALAYHYHVSQKDALAHEVRNQLLVIADMKVKHIAMWRSEKVGEARMILASRFTLEAMERLVTGRSSKTEAATVQRWMDGLCRELHYAGVSLTDARGNPTLSQGRKFGDPDHLRQLAVQVASRNDVWLSDFRLDGPGAPMHLGLNVPLRLEPGAPVFGALLIGLDPEDYLFPVLRRWPVPNGSAESLLVRREGDDVVYLSPLRYQAASAPPLRLSANRAEVAAVRAVLGEEGAIEARDYRGIPVFAAVQAVPDTPWRLVAKIDAEEVLAPLRWRSGLTGALAISLISVAGAAVFVLWRRHELQSYRARYQSELERREAAERYDAERKAMNEELRHALEALQASESRFRGAFEQAGVGMVQATLDGAFVRVNQRYCDITGYPAEELLHLKYTDITHPDDQIIDQERMGAILRVERPTDKWEKRYVRKDGCVIWVTITASLVRAPSGEPLQVLAVIEDITARVLAKEALGQSEERFRHVVEHAPEGIIVAAGLEMLYLNPVAVRLFGANSAGQLMGGDILDRVHPDDRATVRGRSATVSTGSPVPLDEHRYLRLDGAAFPVEVSATPIVYDGRSAALVFFRDMTERKQAEEDRARLEQRLRQAQKMESVGRLAGGVAHDFNNHLTVINGYCEMLLDALGVDDPLREEITEVRAAGERAAALTQQLLAFSRKQIVEPRPIILNGVVEEFCRLARRLIGDDIEVATELDPSLGAAMVDRGQMHQILMNLAVNARDAMPSGGKITLATGNVDFADEGASAQDDVKPGSYVLLAVSDTGSGMSPDTLQKIFEPFFTTKPMGVGTGLGLATVYGIVEQSRGYIRVSSELERGTSFRIYLPRIAHALKADSAPPQATGCLCGSETVLVVEDQADVRKLALGILKKNGYRLLEASNGPEALNVAEAFAEPIDLVVTDVVMPGMTGRDLAARLQASRPNLKVLYISGYTADVIAHEGVLDPGVAYLPKPFTAVDLSTKVREVLGDAARSGRILVIDDDPAVLEFLSGILGEAGYDVLTAADSNAGLWKVEHDRVDLVITALVMTNCEGLEIVRVLHDSFPKVRVIAMSGALEGELLKAAGVLGAQAAFLKPIDPELLLPAVRELIG